MKTRGTFTLSASECDPQKVAQAHSSLRANASASAKVGSRLLYQAALLTLAKSRAFCASAKRVISENSPNRTAAVLRMAISDHCL